MKCWDHWLPLALDLPIILIYNLWLILQKQSSNSLSSHYWKTELWKRRQIMHVKMLSQGFRHTIRFRFYYWDLNVSCDEFFLWPHRFWVTYYATKRSNRNVFTQIFNYKIYFPSRSSGHGHLKDLLFFILLFVPNVFYLIYSNAWVVIFRI